MASADELVARLRQRAEDPQRRIDVAPNTVAGPGGLLDLGSLLREVTRPGGPRLERVSPPASPALPGRASPDAVSRAERTIGGALPPLLRRLYLEIADGGFGPGFGLKSIGDLARAYQELRRDPPGPDGLAWPVSLVPLIEEGGNYACVDIANGSIVNFDGEELLEHWDPDEPDDEAAARGWAACFKTIAPSVEAWLESWLAAPTVAERVAAQMPRTREDMMAMHLKNLRESIARYEGMTTEERRKHIPDPVWESMKRQVERGGLD